MTCTRWCKRNGIIYFNITNTYGSINLNTINLNISSFDWWKITQLRNRFALLTLELIKATHEKYKLNTEQYETQLSSLFVEAEHEYEFQTLWILDFITALPDKKEIYYEDNRLIIHNHCLTYSDFLH